MPRKAAPAADGGLADPQQLFRRLENRSGLVLAVSGGSDSTALMLLAAQWRERPPLLVATVDHGLRAESASEARTVTENAERLQLPWRILKALPRTESGNLQDWARRARYQRLVEAARDAGFDTIVTAHHRDDQAETFLLRLARGSGVYGLAAMPDEGSIDGISLARPLLKVPRTSLATLAAASGLATIDDPSNANPRFDRVRMRALMPALAEEGLSVERLAETAGRMRRAAAALDHYATALLRDCFSTDRFGIVSGNASSLAKTPEEVALRALALILRAVGGADYTPELQSVEALHAALVEMPPDSTLRRTLHGVVVSIESGRMEARREWGRGVFPVVEAPAGATFIWDRRFRITIPQLPGRLEVGALGRAAVSFMSPGIDRDTLKTLPALFQNGTPVAHPPGVSGAEGGSPHALSVDCLVGERLAPHRSGG
jgi:tRNA(Ile)-lysidine synthase